MKKLLNSLFMTLAFVVANAQPTPSFWSNWSIGGNVIASREIKNSEWNIGQGTNIGLGLKLHKQLTTRWGFRVLADVPGFFTADTLMYDRYGKGLIGFDYAFGNGIYVFADGGGAMLFDGSPLLKLAADLGVGYKYDFNERNSLFAELGADVVASFPSNWENTNVFIKLGYMYNFGLTKTDKQIRDDYDLVLLSMPLIEQTSTINDSIAEYHTKTCQDLTIAHLEKIDALYHENENLFKEIKLKDSTIFALDSIIKSIKDNGDNFYAMPFSVEFDNDSYAIKVSEYEKLKQVAYIMKSDTNITYIVRGFCDYTGSDEYNQKLSEKRAEEVKKFLVNRCGVKEDHMKADGKGKSVSFGEEKSPINRRVSFIREF